MCALITNAFQESIDHINCLVGEEIAKKMTGAVDHFYLYAFAVGERRKLFAVNENFVLAGDHQERRLADF